MNLKLKWISPDGLEKNMKATAHKSGKLGFTMDAAEKMQLSADKSVNIAINEDDPADKNLYVMINSGVSEGGFKISKAGQYYYINTKALFESLKIDYRKDWIVYDISRETIDGQLIYVFRRREKEKKGEKPNDT